MNGICSLDIFGYQWDIQLQHWGTVCTGLQLWQSNNSKQGDVMQNTKMAKMGLSETENEVPSGQLTTELT